MSLFCLLLASIAAAPAGVPLDIATDTWRTQDDVIVGWDWSLPPGTKPRPGTGLKFSGETPANFQGLRQGSVDWSWRKLEPEEGRFDFEALRRAILEQAKRHDSIELHLRASVWELRNFPNETKYPPGWVRHMDDSASAPRWLAKYNIPLIEEKKHGLDNIGTPFQVINMDIYNPAYHERYMRMLDAFSKSGIPQMDEITVCMIHVKSSSRGEEGEGPDEGPNAARFAERLRAWAAAFKGVEHKLCYVANKGKQLDLAYELGMGQRNGFVEMYQMHVDNPQLGQSVDGDGYLVVDESCPPIAQFRAFGDENEEYSPSVHVNRFGPMELWAQRYRESMLRALQMRRTYLWTEPNSWVCPALLNYVGLELGRNVEDAPDAWCHLREGYNKEIKGEPRPIKNFERWLCQRDAEGALTEPAVQVPVSPKMFEHHPGRPYDYNARRTNKAQANTAINFAIDDRFLGPEPARAAIKNTYYDQGTGTWDLAVQSANGPVRRTVTLGDTGAVKTATFFIDNARFPAQNLDPDFRIEAGPADATISLVRVIKVKAPHPTPLP